VYLGGIRQATSIIAVDRGTTDLSARDGFNNFSGIVAHEAVSLGSSTGANFTATGGSGYFYSELVVNGGAVIPTSAVVSADYVEVLTAGLPASRVESNYVEVLSGGAPKAQIEATYLEVLTNTPTMRTESVYAEVLVGGSSQLQTSAVYVEVMDGGNPQMQTVAVYAEVISSVQKHLKGWGIIK
jgi:hypothetical protein